MEQEPEQDKSSPPKPPAPILPQKPCLKVTKPTEPIASEQITQDTHFIEGGTESASSNVSNHFYCKSRVNINLINFNFIL